MRAPDTVVRGIFNLTLRRAYVYGRPDAGGAEPALWRCTFDEPEQNLLPKHQRPRLVAHEQRALVVWLRAKIARCPPRSPTKPSA